MKMNKILLMALLVGIATPQCSAGVSDFFSSILFGSEQASAGQQQNAQPNANESFFDQASQPFTNFANKFADIAKEKVKQETADKGIFGSIADAIQNLFMNQILGKITGFFDWVIDTLQAGLRAQGQPQAGPAPQANAQGSQANGHANAAASGV